LGDVLEDGRVIDKSGNVVGRLLPDGLVVDAEGSLIGIEESAKKRDTAEMFVPAGTFGNGGAYGTGSGGVNLGPGGGFGPGERYDSQRASALAAAQGERRQNMAVGKISTNVKKDAFDGYQKNWDEQGIPKAISSWRVDMSEMIFADKPIPAVIARSIDSSNPAPVTAYVERNVYAEEGRNIIIPAGSRLMGTLGSVTASQESASESAKVQITWERLVRPDGVVFMFQGLTGDAQGRGGALGYLDQQLFKKYSMPLMTTILTSATSYLFATDDSGAENESSKQQAANDARENFLDQMNQIFNQILSDKTNIRALTYVPAGTRIIVYPNVDLWLRTWERDAEVSTNEVLQDVLIDDKKSKDRNESNAIQRKTEAASSRVVYEADGTDAAPAAALISEAAPKKPASTIGAPPPPPSSGTGSSSSGSSGSSGSSIPQLF
jgi:type IV secretion system protein VirB10